MSQLRAHLSQHNVLSGSTGLLEQSHIVFQRPRGLCNGIHVALDFLQLLVLLPA